MIRPLFRVFLFWASALAVAHSHVVTQIYGEWKERPGSWEIEILFEGGYAEPDIRDDPAASAPERDWLMAQGEEGWARLRKEAERYLRKECLEITSAGQPVEWQVEFPDFRKSPPDFPVLLNNGAYMRLVITPVSPQAGSVMLGWKPGEPPTFILKKAGVEGGYVTMDAGDHYEIKPSGSAVTGDDARPSAAHGALWTSFRQGYEHVIPQGWDHVLFVLGLFFYRRKWRPLLNQSLAFTAAHTVTLGLAAAGIVKITGNWVEPLISLSLAAVALENLRAGKEGGDGRIRLAVVFGFGLIHGLGFAGALSAWLRPGDGFLPSLLMANLGVEAAQATLLAGAWVLTLRWNETEPYRVFRLACCVAIAGTGIWWTLQRVGLV